MIILHNWFPSGCRGLIVAVWQASALLIPIMKASLFPDTGNEYFVRRTYINIKAILKK
jgi:hypothetical protein